MLAKDLVKGDRVKMGWEFAYNTFTIVHGTGNIRTVKYPTQGFGMEYTSIYIWDIVDVLNPENGKPLETIQLTPNQLKDKDTVQSIMARF
jgi:hypothetical protein